MRWLRYLLCRSSQASGITFSAFSSLPRFWIGSICIHRDDARYARMRRSKHFREEAFGRFPIALRAEEKFQGSSLRIHRAIEIHPPLFYFDGRLIDAPRVVRGLEMEAATCLQFRRV